MRQHLAVEAARLDVHVETIYYAALRRHLALIGIEQGDASEADLWHSLRGGEWASWFGDREVARAVAASGGGGVTTIGALSRLARRGAAARGGRSRGGRLRRR